MATASLSRGCFLFKPTNTAPVLSGSMRKLPMEDPKHTRKREQLLTECWEAVGKEIHDITSRQHDKVFSDLLQFMASSHEKLQDLHTTLLGPPSFSGESTGTPSFSRKKLPPRLEVSTAVLITGVNMPDHAVLFERLENQIHDHCSPYTVLLRARDCNSGMKATMKRILLQLMNVNTEQLYSTEILKSCDPKQQKAVGRKKFDPKESSDEEDHKPLPSHKPGRLPLCSMRVLCEWYAKAVGAGGAGNRPPVIIVIQDLEAFVPLILQDLILSLSPRLPEFPAVLVLGVATSIGAVHRMLPQRVTSLLSITQFQTQHSALTLAQIMDRVLLTHQFPFKLGPKALKFLLHQFYYCNFSLADFSRGFMYAMMEHFYWQPLSMLCSGSSASSASRQLAGSFCESVRATPSFQRYIESLGPSQRLPLLESNSRLKVTVEELLCDLESYHQTFYPLLQCLHHLTHDLPEAPLGKKLHEVYSLCLEQNIVEQSKFQWAWKLVSTTSKNDLSGKVSLCVQTLKQAMAASTGSSLQVFKEVMEIFTNYTLEASQQDKVTTSTEAPPSELPSQETTGQRKLRFQEHLRQASSRRNHPSALEVARSNLTNSLHTTFKQHLHAPEHLPLHEAFYFDQVSSLRLQLAPSPRQAIQTALSNPAGYLAEASIGGYPDKAISSNMPDVCIAYQLHLEYGKLINLYDWLQAFVLVVNPATAAEEDEEGGSQKKDIDPVLHARFIQAVSELQLLGFIKPTQRKTDHVQRLTWGLC